MPIRTIVWGENIHEQTNAVVRGIYPDGMHVPVEQALEPIVERGPKLHPAGEAGYR